MEDSILIIFFLILIVMSSYSGNATEDSYDGFKPGGDPLKDHHIITRVMGENGELVRQDFWFCPTKKFHYTEDAWHSVDYGPFFFQKSAFGQDGYPRRELTK